MADENQTNQGMGGNAGGGAGGTAGAGGGTGTADMQRHFETTKTHARQAAEELRTAATEIAGQYRGKAEQAWTDAQTRVRTLQEDGEQYVRENPTKAVFTALGIGFILGIMFRR
ncbi:MAG TPA: hypothetical protein VG095_00700 [Chthoniobacterales bacterium]|nr:hypothetical protein [Chthoniobacterales bacterium]